MYKNSTHKRNLALNTVKITQHTQTNHINQRQCILLFEKDAEMEDHDSVNKIDSAPNSDTEDDNVSQFSSSSKCNPSNDSDF